MAVNEPENCTVAPPLPAQRDAWERQLIEHPELLGEISRAVGGPFHVLYPERVIRNIRAFQQVFAEHDICGAVYFGKKANKSGAVARACAQAEAGVDVSSIGEMTAALSQGIRGEELLVTGPEKAEDLLWLGARHRALVTIDSPTELTRLGDLDIPARVLLRILPPDSESRFGMTKPELSAALSVAAQYPRITLVGVSFHLGGYDPPPRARLAHELLEWLRKMRTAGQPAQVLSIGGGFAVDYLPADNWTTFREQVDPRWFHSAKRFDSFYPYHSPWPGPQMLHAVLRQRNTAGQTLAERLRAETIRLVIEPGRAVLDRAGSSVFPVQGAKTRFAHGKPYRIVTVASSSTSLSEQWHGSEFLPDPTLWPEGRIGVPTATVVGGATCLESDMLSWRRILLPRSAEAGDLLLYPNTAGYQMDSNETTFHQLPLPTKVVLTTLPDGRLQWSLDTGNQRW